ncbi:MAG: RIP metalloprotease RseP [Gammaproteobacteria bacterium]|nr:RIP metalloprotease RseP [Gammaproteobacteria bacterium]
MGSAIGSVLAFIVAISVLVAVHEYGHYIVGRWTGMKVLRFSIGFGKPIWTRIGGKDRTEYCVSAIPLGGYVRFLDTREGPIPEEDEGRAFNQRPVPQRIAVLLAGPAFNFLFAILAYWALFIYGIPTLVPAVGAVEPDSYAARAGLEQGDRIVAVGEVQTADWESALVAMLNQMVSDGRVPLTLEAEDGWRRDATIDVGADARRLTEPGMLFDGLGFRPFGAADLPADIGRVEDDGPAKAAGLEAGDRIVGIDGVPILDFGDLVAAVQPRANQRVSVDYVRDGQRLSTALVIREQHVDGEVRGRIGVAHSGDFSDFYYQRRYGPVDSIGEAMARTWSTTVFTLRMLARMVTGDVSIKNISGPINIAQFAGESAQRGLDYFLGFLAIVSISLGVLNLLPIPVLDGGQIVYQTIEGLKGSPLSEKAQILGQQIGIFALILLMSFAFYNDLARIFG